RLAARRVREVVAAADRERAQQRRAVEQRRFADSVQSVATTRPVDETAQRAGLGARSGVRVVLAGAGAERRQVARSGTGRAGRPRWGKELERREGSRRRELDTDQGSPPFEPSADLTPWRTENTRRA